MSKYVKKDDLMSLIDEESVRYGQVCDNKKMIDDLNNLPTIELDEHQLKINKAFNKLVKEQSDACDEAILLEYDKDMEV